jgi:lipoprotein-anchoring transpeptidase ErfK/SrfK
MLDSRRGTLVAIGSGVVAVGAVGGLGTYLAVNRPTIDGVFPTAGGAVASPRTPISARVAHGGRLNNLHVTLDGRDVTSAARAAGERVVIAPKTPLSEGSHHASISFTSSNPLARSVARDWGFAVDTKPPAVSLGKGPLAFTRRTVTLAGSAEPGSRVSATWKGGAVATTAGAGGAWSLAPRLPEGNSPLRLMARDVAGNARVLQRTAVVDTRPPRLSLTPLEKGALRTDQPVLTGRLVGDRPSVLTYGGSVNGKPFGPVPGRGSTPISGTPGELLATSLPGNVPLQIAGDRFRLALPPLSEGRNRVTLWVKDAAGNQATKRLSALVDSSDEFGGHPMLLGARGGDVRGLQKRLKEARLFRGAPTGRFDARTIKAVRAYQRKFAIPVTGEVGPATLRKMVGRIVISIKNRKLRLIRDGKVVRTYSVAVGQPAYPTPTGRFSIIQKLENPTWTPPSSPWAKGLGPIPPGPGNPLGTRWIGTSADAVGIHGTYADYSIGSAASHGCLRMHIRDVEALYEEVAVGMPVEIRAA